MGCTIQDHFIHDFTVHSFIAFWYSIEGKGKKRYGRKGKQKNRTEKTGKRKERKG